MKIDAFTHILPAAFHDRIVGLDPQIAKTVQQLYAVPGAIDLDERFRVMDHFGDYAQIISLSGPPIESVGPPPRSVDLAKLANDQMAELVARYPDRFLGFVAALPMNAQDALLLEAERAIGSLGAVGAQVYSHVNGRSLTSAATLPLFDLMARLDRPLWLHPDKGEEQPDYAQDGTSRYEIWFVMGWPWATSVAMAHIVFAGIFDKHPAIKIIAHQMGGVVPFLEGRISKAWERRTSRIGDQEYDNARSSLKRRPIDYFRMFLADTVLAGGRDATQCGLSFFPAQNVVFATDMPYGPENGAAYLRETIDILETIDIDPAERHAIFEGNIRRLTGLRTAAS